MPGIRFSHSVVAILLLGVSASGPTPEAAPDPYQSLLDRLQSITTIALSTWSIHEADLAHGEDPSLDPSGWRKVKVGEDWQGSRWLRQSFEVPAQLNGYSLWGARISLDLQISSAVAVEISVFSNGSMVARTDEGGQVPVLLAESAQPGQKFNLAVRVVHSGGVSCCGGDSTRIERADLQIEPAPTRPDPALLRLEILSAEPLIAAYPGGAEERKQQLSAAVSAVDLSALDRGDQPAFDASLRDAQTKLDALRPYMSQFRISAIGNSHIDMAWLWPWTETVEVVRDTFGTALELMREYPDFKFTASTAAAYEWMEEKYPTMFQEIQQRVKEGRWEVIGGMWVEPDLNMPDGESLVRQILYGKRYFQKNFGVDIHIGWNPDSFGYNGQLPQIYKRSGIDYFVTQKLLWAHEFTEFPYRLFWWESPDGSRILTYFPSDYANQIDPQKMARDAATYGPMLWNYGGGTNSAPPGSLDTMYLYGVGDHGGGPTREDLDTAVRWQKNDLLFPKIQFSTAAGYFADLENHRADLKIPTWNGELYFQYHRGVETSQSEVKKGNRKNEALILDAEKLASIDFLLGAAYPQASLDDSWKKILFNQFHDILPGSGIRINYLDAARKYAETERANRDIINGALSDIASRVHANHPGVFVFNPLSWARTEVVEADVPFPRPVQAVSAYDLGGKQLPSEVLNIDPQTNHVKIRMLAEDIPATGYKFIDLLTDKEVSVSSLGRADSRPTESSVSATNISLENMFIRLKVDSKSGCITSLFDKRSNTESLALPVASEGSPAPSPDGLPCGNLLELFVDKPQRWDAWNIDADFIKQHWDLMQADQVELVENTPLRAVIRVKHHFENSSFTQDITLCAGAPRVDVHMQADWHERHILLKVAFPVSVRSEKATFEIPYGTVERPTTRRTPAEQAQFEVPALRWADISDATHGFSLLNDSKYGYDAKDNVLRLSLLRAPTWPDPETDQGFHEFTYSLYPHGGTWREALTVRQGYDLNYPLLATSLPQHTGFLPTSESFFGSEEDNIVVTAVKKAADDDSLILRYYEWAGKKGIVHIDLAEPAGHAWETNLMENPVESLSLGSNSKIIAVPTDPYEIKTVKIRFSHP
jgi:alpha-mannosidase